MTATTPTEVERLLDHHLGRMRNAVSDGQLRVLADRLASDERVVAVAVASRRLLGGGELLVVATDRRLLLVSRASSCEEISYETLMSVTDDAAAGEIALVTRGAVHHLVVKPTCARRLVGAVAARIGAERVHPAAGAAEARIAQRALAGIIVSACVFFGSLACGVVTQGDDESQIAPSHLVQRR